MNCQYCGKGDDGDHSYCMLAAYSRAGKESGVAQDGPGNPLHRMDQLADVSKLVSERIEEEPPIRVPWNNPAPIPTERTPLDAAIKIAELERELLSRRRGEWICPACGLRQSGTDGTPDETRGRPS